MWIYVTRLRGDDKLLATRRSLKEAAQVVASIIVSSHGNATEEDFEHIPMYLPEKEDNDANT